MKMKARIEFEVKDEEEFEMIKGSSELPDETWILIKEDKLKRHKDEK